MLMKTSDLSGEALNFAVCFAEGYPATATSYGHACYLHERSGLWVYPHYLEWKDAGPIIERERIELGSYADQWQATMHLEDGSIYELGPTPLIAAMRCYVASKLGDEVEIPDCLVKGETP